MIKILVIQDKINRSLACILAESLKKSMHEDIERYYIPICEDDKQEIEIEYIKLEDLRGIDMNCNYYIFINKKVYDENLFNIKEYITVLSHRKEISLITIEDNYTSEVVFDFHRNKFKGIDKYVI